MIKIHTFLGGATNPQSRAMCGAKNILKKRFGNRLVYMDVNHDDAKRWGWSEENLIDWLTSDEAIYIINCHPHQGGGVRWSPAQLKEAFEGLQLHCGFPSKMHLQCPIFLQDKIAYLHAVPEICNPTLRIFLEMDRDYNDYWDEITE
jgi:hypothetical protein